MSIAERLLHFLSSTPKATDDAEAAMDNALSLLGRVYGNFSALVSGKHVADFGCGHGHQSIALVKEHDCSVVGIDSNPKTLRKATENAKNHNVSSSQLVFVEKSSPDMENSFDVVISQNSFEHFGNPEKVLDEMDTILKPSGIILLTFGPPWLAPYGAHMHFFCKVPWINVLFPEEAVMKARSRFKSDGARRYEDVESGLNKMTIAKLESIVSSCKLKVTYRKYHCVKGIDWLSKVPLLREFFINYVVAIFCKTT
jgi:ubiquinone/menaquinone biosynthesis C-methylase UbiE